MEMHGSLWGFTALWRSEEPPLGQLNLELLDCAVSQLSRMQTFMEISATKNEKSLTPDIKGSMTSMHYYPASWLKIVGGRNPA